MPSMPQGRGDAMIDQPLPHDKEIEYSLIASVLNGQCPEEVFDILYSSDFYVTVNRDIFSTAIQLREADIPVDSVTVYHFNKTYPFSRLMDFGINCPIATNPIWYAKKIKALSEARQEIINAHNRIKDIQAANATPGVPTFGNKYICDMSCLD
jgi:replicative DNA helicase